MNTTREISPPDAKAAKLKGAKAKILLEDDDPASRRILLHLLAEEGYIVLTAANGVEALELADLTKFDLMLLDLDVPVKDGWETFEKLSSKYPLLPIVLITARPNQFFHLLASGVGALLEKPIDAKKLFHTIRTLLAEPPEAFQARITGRTSAFRHVLPNPAKAQKP